LTTVTTKKAPTIASFKHRRSQESRTLIFFKSVEHPNFLQTVV